MSVELQNPTALWKILATPLQNKHWADYVSQYILKIIFFRVGIADYCDVNSRSESSPQFAHSGQFVCCCFENARAISHSREITWIGRDVGTRQNPWNIRNLLPTSKRFNEVKRQYLQYLNERDSDLLNNARLQGRIFTEVEVNSTFLIASELTNQNARKALFTWLKLEPNALLRTYCKNWQVYGAWRKMMSVYITRTCAVNVVQERMPIHTDCLPALLYFVYGSVYMYILNPVWHKCITILIVFLEYPEMCDPYYTESQTSLRFPYMSSLYTKCTTW